MNNTIAFYEHDQNDGDRKEFQEKINELNLPLFNNWESLSIKIPNILFYHGNNDADLKTTGMYQTFKNDLTNVWLIEFGGYDTRQKNEGDKIISYIKYSDLQNRLAEIVEDISKLSIVTKERLEEIIFGFDPKLEELLKPFANALPLDEHWKVAKPNLYTAQEELIKEVNKKLKQ